MPSEAIIGLSIGAALLVLVMWASSFGVQRSRFLAWVFDRPYWHFRVFGVLLVVLLAFIAGCAER